MELTGSPPSATDGPAVRQDLVCGGCGLYCDDITLSPALEPVGLNCALGRSWFAGAARPSVAASSQSASAGVRNALASLDRNVLDRAAELLASARAPLFFGFELATTDAIRRTLALADRHGACVDTATSLHHGGSILAVQRVGKVSCTLGEAARLGDRLILWGCDPVTELPRLLERAGRLHPNRPITLVDSRSDSATAIEIARLRGTGRDARHLVLQPGSDLDALTSLRAMVHGGFVDGNRLAQATGVPADSWSQLAEAMKGASYGVMLFGTALMSGAGSRHHAIAAHSLARELNRHTAFVCRALPAPGNGIGADSVLLWTTGYTYAVSCSTGYPRFGPEEFSLERSLASGAADLVVFVGARLAEPGRAIVDRLGSTATIWMGADDPPAWLSSSIRIRTARNGVSAAGSVYRFDDVPVDLTPFRSDAADPSDVAVLEALLEHPRLAETRLADRRC
jgi:formylmethanofuran dehydrogenase subunit B